MTNNIFGLPLEPCSQKPLTGFFRDGSCNTDSRDTGVHTVCTIMTADFLAFSFDAGNDLTTPRPEFGFPGLQPGDRWCLCASRWKEAWLAGKAPLVVLEATHEKTLDLIDREALIQYAYRTAP